MDQFQDGNARLTGFRSSVPLPGAKPSLMPVLMPKKKISEAM
jgi:hypothetical protein